MHFKDHPQNAIWSLKRGQRCLSLALVFLMILIFGIYEHQAWPKKSGLSLEAMRPYTYGSTPAAGRPSLPFEDNSGRRSTEEPFFETPYFYDE